MEDISVEIPDGMWDINDPNLYDNSTEKAEFYEYTSQTQANNNSPVQQIRIDINAHDIFTKPLESYISITGQIVRGIDDNAYVVANEITHINNAMLYLFSLVKYEFGSTTMESIIHPGQIKLLQC